MVARISVPLLVLVFAPGCVQTPTPVGDIDTAKPDERLIGTWTDSRGTLVVDHAPVKGHPKGLLRMRAFKRGKDPAKDAPANSLWLFTATVGKHTYGNLLTQADLKSLLPDLGAEGGYEQWHKNKNKGYLVVRLTFDGDTLVWDGGDKQAFEALMAKEKIEKAGDFHTIPVGWLAKYLEKNGPDVLFPGKDVVKFTRAKK